MLDGFVKAYPDVIRKAAPGIAVRAEKDAGKVALVSGGGSGHEPAHVGYVGKGMLDAAVGGPVFTSPSADAVFDAIMEVATEKGILLITKNYTGDVMNFEMAADMARDEGVDVEQVVVDDDVAVDGSTFTVGRRGVAGTVFVHKIAGALAEEGATLADVKEIAEKVISHVRSMGAAIAPCTVPAAGKPGFELGEDEMEIGIGIHGEPDLESTGALASDSEVAVMVNGSGGTPLMELAIVNNHVADVLAEKGISVYRTFMGNYMTSLEMQGFSITLLALDDELKRLLDAPTSAFAW